MIADTSKCASFALLYPLVSQVTGLSKFLTLLFRNQKNEVHSPRRDNQDIYSFQISLSSKLHVLTKLAIGTNILDLTTRDTSGSLSIGPGRDGSLSATLTLH